MPPAMPSGFDFLFRTRPRALWQQTPPEPVLILQVKHSCGHLIFMMGISVLVRYTTYLLTSHGDVYFQDTRKTPMWPSSFMMGIPVPMTRRLHIDSGVGILVTFHARPQVHMYVSNRLEVCGPALEIQNWIRKPYTRVASYETLRRNVNKYNNMITEHHFASLVICDNKG